MELLREHSEIIKEGGGKVLQDLHTKVLTKEYIIKKARLTAEDHFVAKTFEVDILTSRDYYISAWVMATNEKKGINDRGRRAAQKVREYSAYMQ